MSLPLGAECSMAKKRKIEVEKGDSSDSSSVDHKDELPEKDKNVSWGVWVRRTYLKYWYVVGCVFVDLLVALEIARVGAKAWSTSLSVFVLIVLLVVETLLYSFMWKDLKLPWRK
jgi:hypothetical protein